MNYNLDLINYKDAIQPRFFHLYYAKLHFQYNQPDKYLHQNNKLNLYYLVTWNWKINETSIKTEEAMVMEIFYHILHQLHFLNRD